MLAWPSARSVKFLKNCCPHRQNLLLKGFLEMLEIKNLHVSIEGKEILKGVDLTIKPGEIHAVMGPNGEGKSTLAQTLMGHPAYKVEIPRRQATGGRLTALDDSTDVNSLSVESSAESGVRIDKKNILIMSPDERARAGLFLAFQYPVAIAGVSVQNFLWKAYQALHPAKKMKVLDFRKNMETVAVSLGIAPELLKRSLNDGFSGGEKKRVEILQMLVLAPKYIILDEIDSGLDIDAVALVAAGITWAIKEFNPGVLLITHYQRILNYLKPSFVHVMVGGKIVETGDATLVTRLEKDGYAALKKN